MSPIRKLFLVNTLSFLCVIPAAFGDLVKCGEIWTNGKCDTTPSQTLKPLPESPHSEKDLALSVKRSLLHELTTTRYDLQKRYHFSLSQATADKLCLTPESSVAECRKEVERVESRLYRRVQLAKADLEKAAQAQETLRSKREQNSVVVNNYDDDLVIGNNNIIVPPTIIPPVVPAPKDRRMPTRLPGLGQPSRGN